MRPAVRSALVVLAAFAGGTLVGAAAAAWVVGLLLGNARVDVISERIEYQLGRLELLHAGQSGRVVDELERKIDNYVSGWDRDRTALEDASVQRALRHLKHYRGQYPRETGDPQKDAAVKRMLERP